MHVLLSYYYELNIYGSGFEEINVEVQQYANNFMMLSQWLGGIPPIIYSFFVGSLIDQFGCKPFLLLPLIGLFIRNVCQLINYAFIKELPLQFFYMDNIASLFGWMPVFYLGYYSFGILTSKPENRASTLSRFDGFEKVGGLLGIVFD